MSSNNKVGETFGTEDDKINCPFYFKIGACRHGDKCTRVHNKPTISETILIKNMYKNPPVSIAIAEGQKVSDEALKESISHYEDFYESVFLEFTKYGRVEDMYVLDNLGDHLIGNVYIMFTTEEDAKNAFTTLSGKYFGEKPLIMEYSPVTEFRDSRCRQYDDGNCNRGAYCNFMHLKYISSKFKKSLFDQMFYEHPEYRKRKKEDERRTRNRSRSYSKISNCKLNNLFFIILFFFCIYLI